MLHTPFPATPPELVSKQLFMLFPTPMFTGMLPDISVCDRVEKVVRQLHRSGQGRSSPQSAGRAYMTPDDLQTHPEMKELVDVVMRESGIVLDAFAIKRDSHYITNMWAGEYRQPEPPRPHAHTSELLAERPRLYQDAGELRSDHVRFAAPAVKEH